MRNIQRNSLAWLHRDAWQKILGRDWDRQERDILACWQMHQLPLVVCTQRVHQSPPTISVGLPAPNQWGRRKIGLEVFPRDIDRLGVFPSLVQVIENTASESGFDEMLQSLSTLQVPVQVYGSYGWQCLTGLTYVRSTSDLDVIARVSGLAMALDVARVFHNVNISRRLDGELIFPGGESIAWRELLQGVDGVVDRVLVKSREEVKLVEISKLEALDSACSV